MKLLLTILTLAVLLHQTSAQQPEGSNSVSQRVFQEDAEKLFANGVQRFTAKSYREALGDFQQLVQQYPASHRVTAAYIMSAKAQYFLGAYQESLLMLGSFLQRYPESMYSDDAHYTAGLNYYHLGRNEEAAGEFLAAFQTTDDTTLFARSAQWLEDLSGTALTTASVQALLTSATTLDAQALLSVYLADKLFRSGDVDKAEEVILPITEMSLNIRGVSEAMLLLERIRSGGSVKLGVLLPLMMNSEQESEKAAGEALWEGIQLAVEEYNRTSFPRVSVEVRDTEHDAYVAGTHVAELSSDENVLAIVGPAHSEEAQLSGMVAQSRGLPLISPTATARGITAEGEYVFQANPDYDVRGRALAHFALDRLNALSVAVLAPNDEVGRAQAEGFVAEAEMYGAEVVDVQYYEPGATNLQPQFMEIRRKALERQDRYFIDFSLPLRDADVTHMLQWGIPQQTIDELAQRALPVPVDSLFGPDGRIIADSLRIPIDTLDIKLDSLHIPVQNLDALFLPITSPDDIAVLSSQLRYFNFQSHIIGSEEWNDLIELDQNRRYTANVYFPTDSYWSEQDPEYRTFAKQYQDAYGKQPTKSALYAYDTMKMLLRVISESPHERAKIAEALAAVRGYPGIHSKISFTANRVNGVLTILQFKNRSIVRVGEVDMSAGEFGVEE